MRLLLVDDHPLFLEGLSNLLTGRGIEVVGTARDGFEALARVRSLHPDIVLMDIRMPRCTGLEGTRLIKAEFPEVRVVMLTALTDEEDLFDAIRVGASGYLIKTQDTSTFLSSLGELERGEVALAPGLAKRILSEFSRLVEPSETDSEGEVQLSPRQMQILTLICRGLTYKEAGGQLGLAERTVKYHMGEILAKLHLKNRSEAVAYARAHGLNGRD
jgi:DNA-binding NarL/FixJ family response regulator